MKENHFFENQTISSKIKASIISEYFPSYCSIITSKYQPKQIRYIDLFAGPGFYEDGNPSTPILIGKHCSKIELLRQNVKMIFNDNYYHDALKTNFKNEFPEGTFAKSIHFGKSTVGESTAITEFLKANTHSGARNRSKNDFPSLLFIDPFGYKGIETLVLAEFLKNWGNEIFIFVNTKRIHPALENDKFEGLMQDLFPTTFKKLKNDRRFKATVPEKLNLIIDSLGDEYKTHLGQKIFYTAFKFQEEDVDATSHYILHLTKGARGYDLIKTTYNDFANVGTVFDGVNTYTFDAKKYETEINELFDEKSINIDKLADELLLKYKNKQLAASQLFDEHQISGLYSRYHYTEALRKLVDQKKIKAIFTDNKNHKVTVLISKDCLLNFN
ncbi:three-Cys-motif partner protein TcmP [Chryseobacterium sediminis]|uniref:Three-Cys-motif partner protein TcmP n=1 Tax=Chryseobacterium sediminis TaxID=1679494 RepID=A0A5B2UC45_9FLAO|nr:three-Cys-motif partner protein TcmP [Chryseobacterium sediminis]KAA2224003.1 three-Cys-motif partner protein TcmP [Chryseobacterium sediminis]